MGKRWFPWRVFTRLVLIQSVLVLVAVGASGLAARYFFKRQFLSQIEGQLRGTLTSLSNHLPAPIRSDWCANTARDTHFRLTVINREGQVLCDSEHDPRTMENHANRPEVLEAERAGFGSSIRFSTTLNEDMLYGALNLGGRASVLRGAIPLSTLAGTLHVFDASLAAILVLIAVVLLAFAVWSGRELTMPVGRILMKVRGILTHSDSRPRGEGSYGEWTELESSLDEIRRELEAKIEALVLEREQQATLMSAISDAILAVDREGNLLFYNGRFAMLYGRDELAGRKQLWELFREPEILEVFRAAVRKGSPGSAKAIPFDQAGERLYFSLSVSPLKKNQEIYGAVGVFHDVTDLKKAEQMRIDFVANVSHELRTPLTAIKGYADTLMLDVREGKPPEKGFLEIITRNVDRLMSLIHDLLDLSTLESTEVLQKTRLDTAEITAKVTAQLRGSIEAKGQQLEVRNQAASVFADPRRVEQVLVNLLDNASKYTPSGGTLAVAWETGPAGDVLLKVRDTGPGIPIEHQSRLFERFYRVDKARSREVGGTGLGLAIVKHIMQRHQGIVWVESVPGSGATFICRFPG